MKPTRKQITRSFILSKKGEISPALLRQFKLAANVLCDKEKSFNFNDYLSMINPNAKLVDLYFEYLRVIKKERLVRQSSGNWSFKTWKWKD